MNENEQVQKNIAKLIAEELNVRLWQVEAAIGLIDEGNTIPFIARYRKEATGTLDDEQLRTLDERLAYLRNLEEKKQKVIEIKEVQLSLNIDVGDLKTKQNHAIRFLKAGNKVKVSIRFRGREMVHPERGYEIMEQFAASVAEYGTVEKPAKMENRNMLMFLAAKPQK